MAGYTKGPWEAKRMHTGGFDIFDPRGRDVVTVYGGGVEPESTVANARLIAAAPELLEFAVAYDADMQKRFPSGPYGHPATLDSTDRDLWIAAQAAIAKATGTDQ